jgi:hypothetical protein
MKATTRLRRILAGTAIATLVLGGSLAFEQNAGATATGQKSESGHKSDDHGGDSGNEHGKGTDGRNDDGKGDGEHDKGDNGEPRHCDDGHGHDEEHNKHCQPSD